MAITRQEFDNMQPGDIVSSRTNNASYDFKFIRYNERADSACFQVAYRESGTVYLESYTMSFNSIRDNYTLQHVSTEDDIFLRGLY